VGATSDASLTRTQGLVSIRVTHSLGLHGPPRILSRLTLGGIGGRGFRHDGRHGQQDIPAQGNAPMQPSHAAQAQGSPHTHHSTYTRIHAYTHTHTRTHAHTHTRTHAHTHTRTHAHTHTCTHAHRDTRTHQPTHNTTHQTPNTTPSPVHHTGAARSWYPACSTAGQGAGAPGQRVAGCPPSQPRARRQGALATRTAHRITSSTQGTHEGLQEHMLTHKRAAVDCWADSSSEKERPCWC
jgi:hypothetical protein